MKSFAERHPNLSILVLCVALIGAALAVNSCGDSGTAPSAVPSPSPAPSTHGSSSPVAAAACTVAGATIDTEVDGHHTGGYFSAADKGVAFLLKYVFVSGTDAQGCPGPTRGDWHTGLNGAECALTGDRHASFIYGDCPVPGQSEIQTTAFYPDGTTEEITLGVTVSVHNGVRFYDVKLVRK